MTYAEAIDFLYGLRLFGSKLGLQNTSQLAELCGNPQQQLRFIHVAGTNGKGSTCAMLESIYRHAGFRTGLFTSPHLVSFTERIQVDRHPITEADVARHVTEMRELILEINDAAEPSAWAFQPTFFEFVTVLALRYFAERIGTRHRPDPTLPPSPAGDESIVIWETGLGGRLDATNIVTPLVSVITNIQYDHQKWLGDSREDIAREKAGIIKRGRPVITAATATEALAVIRAVAHENNAPIAEINESNLEDPFIRQVHLSLTGRHQRWNAATALATVRALQRELPVSHQQIIEGLEKVAWPGRQQVVDRGGTRYLLDGAHNPDGVATLVRSLQEDFAPKDITLILGLFEDKDWRSMCRLLVPLASRVYLVPITSERSAQPETVRDFCRSLPGAPEVSPFASLEAALGRSSGCPFVVIAGSLHLVGEAMEQIGLAPDVPSERQLNEWNAARAQ